MAILRHIIDEAEKKSDERIQEMHLLLIKIMVAAVQRQPNVSKEVKNALPRLEVIIDHLEEAKKVENEARRKLTSFAAIAGGGSFKRQASASPLAPAEGAKLAKKKKGSAAVQKPPSEEWTVVQNDKKKKKKEEEGKGGKAGKTLPDPKTSQKKRAKRRLRPEAIALRPAEGKTYAEILGGIRSKVDPKKSGTEIKAVRKTRSRTRDVLIEIRKTKAEGKQGFTDALKEALGESGSVRVLVPRTTLEIRDMDSCTTVEEVELALGEKLQSYEGRLDVPLPRPNAVGQRMAASP